MVYRPNGKSCFAGRVGQCLFKDFDVGNSINTKICQHFFPRHWDGLKGPHSARRSYTLVPQEREVTGVGADIDERVARLQQGADYLPGSRFVLTPDVHVATQPVPDAYSHQETIASSHQPHRVWR
jgi:hypothetical protein